MHHIICDGSTMMIIMDELNKYYNDEEVEELEIQYSDYAIHLNEKKNNGELNEQIEVYREIFSNEYEILNIPTKNNINNNEYNGKEENINEESNQSNKIEQIIDKSASEMINEFIKQHNISKTALFISIYGYVLSKYSEQNVVYTSMMSTNRNNQYVENMAGMFVSTLPLLLKYTNDENRFIETIKENMELLENIYNHQDISFAELAEILKLKKVNNSFIFQPKISKEKIILQNSSIFYIDDENKKKNINSLFRMENLIKQENGSKFDISFNILENKENYLISIEYNTKLYDSLMIKNIVDSYIEIIKNINHLESHSTQNIEYIPVKEENRMIKEFNSDVNKEGCDKLYHEEFRKIAEKYPDRIAIVFNEDKITYKELDEISNSLAYYLRSQGIERNDIVPIICDRSPYHIIGILGISKAGGAFLPVDKNLPNERIQFILEDVNPKLVLYRNCKEVIDKLKSNDKKDKYKMYDLEKHNYSLNCNRINNINKSDDILYVIFTSGTTGNPKGALIRHFNILNYIREFGDEKAEKNYCLNNILNKHNIQNILSITNFSFDMSHNEILYTLVHGARIILVDDIIYNDIELLSKYILKNNVEFIKTTPSRMKLLMENKEIMKYLNNLRIIMLGGEELSIELCNKIFLSSNCKLFNSYGPTESS
eukprot:jgi/Orpsp1_1/1187345/evm.model.d7180000057042.1